MNRTLAMAIVIGAGLSAAIVGAEPPAATAQTQPAEKGVPAVGDMAEDFALPTVDGKDVKLSDQLKAGTTIVVFLRGWPGYQCPLCTRQVGELIERAGDIKEAGASVILIYPGPADKLREHAKEFLKGKPLPAPLTLVADGDMKVVSKWRLRWDAPGETAYPSTFVIDKTSKIRWAKVSKGHGGRASAAEVIDAVKAAK